ncbi:hypothetical protein M514_20149 [Trichuris suis]|uniref:Uncharacterized protein n=1 Tax=Trichuris suis TaxID=68888 RepID=A0A085NDV7_9BILA|nr:hypothetical protein M514_20149 [Trichuris suis]
MAVENGSVVGLSNHVQKAESVLENVRKRYAMFINNKPIAVFSVTTILLGALTALGFHLASAPDFSDPKAGFETRGTILSDRVLTWNNLEQRISFYPDSGKEFYRQMPPNIIQRSKRAETNKTEKPTSGQHLEEIFFTALTSSPCLQLNAPLNQRKLFVIVSLSPNRWYQRSFLGIVRPVCAAVVDFQANSSFPQRERERRLSLLKTAACRLRKLLQQHLPIQRDGSCP